MISSSTIHSLLSGLQRSSQTSGEPPATTTGRCRCSTFTSISSIPTVSWCTRRSRSRLPSSGSFARRSGCDFAIGTISSRGSGWCGWRRRSCRDRRRGRRYNRFDFFQVCCRCPSRSRRIQLFSEPPACDIIIRVLTWEQKSYSNLPFDSFCVMIMTSSFRRLSSPLVWPWKS